MSGELDGVPELERANPHLMAFDGQPRIGIDWVRRSGLRWDERDGVVYTLAFVSAQRDRWLRRTVLMVLGALAVGMAIGAMLVSS